MRMQRIAWAALVAGLLTTLTGCPQPEREREITPSPLLSTRSTQPKPTPQQKPQQPEIAEIPNLRIDTKSLMPRGGITANNWKVIVVHHSATEKDTPQQMDRYHRFTRGWSNGLGYHFVIGNGVNYPDGQIFVGPRWRQQIQGAHCKANAGKYFGVSRPDNYFNDHGIGICLIGDFEGHRPTAKQLATLQQLITFLCAQTRINPNNVYGHGEVTNKTACPGRMLRAQLASVRRNVAGALAAAGVQVGPELPIALCNANDATPTYGNLLRSFAVRDAFAEGIEIGDGLFADPFDDVADAQAGCGCGGIGGNLDDEDPVSGFFAAIAALPCGQRSEPGAAPEHFTVAQGFGPLRLTTFDAHATLETLAVSLDFQRDH